MMTPKPIKQSWENVTGKHMGIANFVAGFMAFSAMLVWLNVNYMSTAKGAELTRKVNTIQLNLDSVAKEISISNALGTVSRLETRRDYLSDVEVRDGVSDALTVKQGIVTDDLKIAVEYKNCIIKEETGCKYLKN